MFASNSSTDPSHPDGETEKEFDDMDGREGGQVREITKGKTGVTMFSGNGCNGGKMGKLTYRPRSEMVDNSAAAEGGFVEKLSVKKGSAQVCR
jgi:hypothetical protein